MVDDTLLCGEGRLFTEPDPDRLRESFRSKNRGLVDKRMSAREAVATYVTDGCYLAGGGFGQTRIPTALLHEVVRQGRKNLGLSGHTATHDFQILAAGRCFDRCDVAYIIGLEMRGLSPWARAYCESGAVELTEWTNAALLWRYRAAAMGVSFLPTRSMLGTDTLRHSAGKEMRCPFTGKKYVAVPALAPDVALIHVQRADIYGNCQIDGSTVADLDLAAASQRVVVSCERLIPNREIRDRPDRTQIPFYMVDAVVEVPYGGYPGNVPGEYYSDEEHLRAWMDAEREEATREAFVDRMVRNPRGFDEYLQLCGGLPRLAELRRQELLIGGEGGR